MTRPYFYLFAVIQAISFLSYLLTTYLMASLIFVTLPLLLIVVLEILLMYALFGIFIPLTCCSNEIFSWIHDTYFFEWKFKIKKRS